MRCARRRASAPGVAMARPGPPWPGCGGGPRRGCLPSRLLPAALLAASLAAGPCWPALAQRAPGLAGRSLVPETRAVHGQLIAMHAQIKQRWVDNRPVGAEHAIRVTDIERIPLNYDDKEMTSKERRLTQDLSHQDAQVRRAAASGLLRLAEDKALEAIQFENNKVTMYSEPEKYRIFGPRTYQALLNVLHDPDWKVRWDAALVFNAAWKVDKMGVDPYMAKLNQMICRHDNETDPVEPHIDLLEAAGRCGHAFYPYSSTFVKHNAPTGIAHPDWRVRYAAVIALQQMGLATERHRVNLLQLTRDENAEVRKVANTFWTPKDGGLTYKWVDTRPQWKLNYWKKKRKYNGKS
ncbi:unnamed protein product [Prorocentrum cordatum]|uniref:HEAT repeat domain-containing protein n=1 Tax=Prorocentrum cordatum TaxID=2364126 RepID=A0ABN9VCG1_9DINO|nr:unnamed protein product [Polarella glacialis]